MAFDRTNYATSGIGQGSGAPKFSTYITSADNKAAVIASGYFDGIADELSAGDFIGVKASDGSVLVAVAAVTAGVVTTLSIALA